jgi:ABC-type spermidine/putrescine transport system permease subunit I
MAKDVVSVFEEDNKTETREFTTLTYHLESELENYPTLIKPSWLVILLYYHIFISLMVFLRICHVISTPVGFALKSSHKTTDFYSNCYGEALSCLLHQSYSQPYRHPGFN